MRYDMYSPASLSGYLAHCPACLSVLHAKAATHNLFDKVPFYLLCLQHR